MRSEHDRALMELQQAVSDYQLALRNDGFAECWGGVELLHDTMLGKNKKYEDMFNTLGDIDAQ